MAINKNFDALLEESIKNIRKDREKTSELLNDLIAYIAKGEDRHREVGLTLAKYLETLQRSNEQLVKLTAIQKKDSDANEELSEKDRENIFDALKSPLKKAKSK